MGRETVSPTSIDTLAFHFALLAAAAVCGYFLSEWSQLLLPQFRLPVFCLAYLSATAMYRVFRATGVISYVDTRTMGHISGGLTDILVVFGIASIAPAILVAYAVPLALLFAMGIAICCLVLRLLGPRFFSSYWFERSLFTWGWITGVTAMGIALLRVVDPRSKSGALTDFGLAYLFIAPIEIGLVIAAPQLLMGGQWRALAGFTLVGAIALVALRLKARDTVS